MMTPNLFSKHMAQASRSGCRFSLGLSLGLGLDVCLHSVGQLLECGDLGLQRLRCYLTQTLVVTKKSNLKSSSTSSDNSVSPTFRVLDLKMIGLVTS